MRLLWIHNEINVTDNTQYATEVRRRKVERADVRATII